MKKKAFFFVILLLGSMAASADVAPKITIVEPFPDVYIKNNRALVKWTHSAYFDTHPQTCRIFCGSESISPAVPVTSDSFWWNCGQKADGTFFPQGSYKITIESPDYDALSGPTILIADEAPKIDITAPASGAALNIGSKCMIRWTHTSYFNLVPQTCRIFCGEATIISPEVPVLNGEFEWTVGSKAEGADLAAGSYQITLESPDYDVLNGPHITLAYGITRTPVKRFIEYIPLHKDPGCPMCFQINPADLKFDPPDDPVTIEIVRGRSVFTRLGKFGRGQALPGPVMVKLEEEVLHFIKSRQRGFELRVLSADGKIVRQQAVMLEIAR